MIFLKRSKTMLRYFLVVYLLMMTFSFSSTFAQATAAGEATATVLTGLTVTAIQNLNFGNVLQGIAKEVDNNEAANAGIFTIAGQANGGISAFLGLPEYLATSVAPLPEDRMTIVFNIDDCSIDNTGNVDPASFGGGFLNINPHSLPGGMTIGATNMTAIFLGGRVIPSVGQLPGVYTGLIILTVSYNGT